MNEEKNIYRKSLSQISVLKVFLLGALVLSMMGDRPVLIQFGKVSLLGVFTALVAGGGILLFTLKPRIRQQDINLVWPLFLFWGYDLVSTLWSPLIIQSIQDTVVWGGFLFLVIISAQASRLKRSFVNNMFWVIDVATIPLILYSIYLIWSGTTSVSAIPILFLLIICYHLVRWHAGSTWGVVVASIFCITNILVGARTPGGIGLGLYLLIEMMLGGRRRWLRIVVIGILLGIATVAVWLTYPPLRDTFLGGDSGLTFGSVAINTSGRIYMWQLTLESYMSSPWLGLGVDAPPEILYARGQHHPHNDYLRILHHLGATGLLLWLLFYGRLMNRVWGAWKRLRHTLRESEHAQLFGTTFMAMVAAGLTMLTDNTIVYSFVMYPLALLIGSSIGVLSAK